METLGVGVEAARGRIKGVLFREFADWYAKEAGQPAMAEAVARMADADQALLDAQRPGLGIVVSDWYPAALGHRLIDATLVGHSDAEKDAMAWRSGLSVVEASMRGLQKLAFELLMTPARYRTYIQRIWNLNFDSGRCSVEDTGQYEQLGTIRQWRGHHPFICKMIVAGKPKIYQAMGCRSVEVRVVSCVSNGSDACRSQTRWNRSSITPRPQ